MSDLADEILVEKALAGDDTAFGHLMQRHQNAVFRFVLSFVKNPEDAEDLTQEVFIKAHTKLSTLKNTAKPENWLCGIAKNESNTWLRRRETPNSPCTENIGKVKPLPTPDEVLNKELEKEEVRAMIGGLLSDNDRTTIDDYFGDKSSREPKSNRLRKRWERLRPFLRVIYVYFSSTSSHSSIETIEKQMGVDHKIISGYLRRARKQIYEHYQNAIKNCSRINQEMLKFRFSEERVFPWIAKTTGRDDVPNWWADAKKQLGEELHKNGFTNVLRNRILEKEGSIRMSGLDHSRKEIEEDFPPKAIEEMLKRIDIPPEPSPRRNLFSLLIARFPLSDRFFLHAIAVSAIVATFLSGNSRTSTFQPTYTESSQIVEIVDVPIIEIRSLKPPMVSGNQENGAAAKTGAGSQNDRESDKGSWTQTKGPYGGTITALHPTSDGNLLAGTLSSGIFRLADNGETWVHASEGLHSIPPAIRAFDQKGNTLYVGTDHGLHYSTNSGDSWQQLTDERISGVAIIGDTIYIGRLAGGVLFSNDNGKSWTPFDSGLPDLDFSEGLTLFACGTTLFAQTRGHVFATKQPVKKSPTRLIFMGALQRHVFRLKAGEKSWTKLTIKDTRKENTDESDITKIVVSGEIVYAVTANGGLFCSTDMGDSWQWIAPEAMQDSNVELMALGNAVFCINSVDGRVFQSTNAGDSWTMFNTDLTNQRILSNTAVSHNTLYVGTQNGVFRSADGGESWTKATTGIPNLAVGDLVSFRKALWTVTGDGIVKSVDGGYSWVPVNDGLIANDGPKMPGSSGMMMWAGARLTVSEGKLYVAMTQSNSSRWNPSTSGIYCLAEDENSWLPIHTNMPSFNGDSIDVLDRLAISGKTFYVIAHARLHRWRVGEDIWTDLGLRVLDEEGLAVSGRTVYVAREDGKLLRSVDEGDNWTDVSRRLPNWNLQSKRNYQQSIYDLHFVDETIYAGSDYRVLRSIDGDGTRNYDGFYRVFRSTDGGETWEQVVDGLPSGGLNIQLVHDAMLYGTNAQGIFRLRHGSDSWEQIDSSMSDVVSLAVDGTTFYIETAKKRLFRLSLAK